jgi:competence protein ComEC
VRRVDWVAYSHADGDHIGGLAAVAMQFDAREIWEGVPVETDARRAGMRRIAAEQGAVWRGLRRGDRWEAGGAQLEVVHPPDPDWHRPRVRNDDSLVFRLRYGRFEALLTGDIGRDVERDLVLRADPRMDPLTTSSRLRVLKVAHHGSRTSSSHDFLARYRPWAAIVSAGRNNPFGHPAPEVTMRLGEVGATTLRTDRDGAVSIETDGTTLSMKTWAGRRWRVSMAEGP